MTSLRMFREFALWQTIMLVAIGVACSQMISPSCPQYESHYCACSSDDQPELKTVKMCMYGSVCLPCPSSLQDHIICDECVRKAYQNLFDVKGLYNPMNSYNYSDIPKQDFETFLNHLYAAQPIQGKNYLGLIKNDGTYFPKPSDKIENANNTNDSIITETKLAKNTPKEYHQHKASEQEEMKSAIPADNSEVYVYGDLVQRNRSDDYVILSGRDTDTRNKQSFIENTQVTSRFDNKDYTTVDNEDDSKSFQKVHEGKLTEDQIQNKMYLSKIFESNVSDTQVSFNKSAREKCETKQIVSGSVKSYFLPLFDFQCVIYRMSESSGSNHSSLNTTVSKKNRYYFKKKDLIPLLHEILKCLNEPDKHYSVRESKSEVVVSNCPFTSIPNILTTILHVYANENGKNAEDVNSPVSLLHRISEQLTNSLRLSIKAYTKYSTLQNSSDVSLTNISLNDTGKLSILKGRLRINITLSLVNNHPNGSESKLPLKNIQVRSEPESKHPTDNNKLKFPSTNIVQAVQSQINHVIYELLKKPLRGLRPNERIKIKVPLSFAFINPSKNQSNDNIESRKQQSITLLVKRLIQNRDEIYSNDSMTFSSKSYGLSLLPGYNGTNLETSNATSRWTDLKLNDFFIRIFYKLSFPFSRKQIKKDHGKPLQINSSYLDNGMSSKTLNSTSERQQYEVNSYNPIEVKLNNTIQSIANNLSTNHDRNITIIVWSRVFHPLKPNHHFLHSKEPFYNGVLKYLPSYLKNDPLMKKLVGKYLKESKNSSGTSGHAAKQLQTKDESISLDNRNAHSNDSLMNFPTIHANPALVLLKDNQKESYNFSFMNHSEHDIQKDNEGEYKRFNVTHFYNLKDRSNASNEQLLKYYLSTNGKKSYYLLHTELSNLADSDKTVFLKENSLEENPEETALARNESDNEISDMKVLTRKLLENFNNEDEDEPDQIIVRLLTRESYDASNSEPREVRIRKKRQLPQNNWCSINLIRRHGKTDCTIWSYKKLCKLSCHRGYSTEGKQGAIFKCKRKEDRWNPGDIRPCVKVPAKVRQPGRDPQSDDDVYYYNDITSFTDEDDTGREKKTPPKIWGKPESATDDCLENKPKTRPMSVNQQFPVIRPSPDDEYDDDEQDPPDDEEYQDEEMTPTAKELELDSLEKGGDRDTSPDYEPDDDYEN